MWLPLRVFEPLARFASLARSLVTNDIIAPFLFSRFIFHLGVGLDTLKMDILHDFFTCAFDGSGAANYYDAGSCIDGRLTSAWNWCQALQSKPYYPIFKLTGFVGFDGEFK